MDAATPSSWRPPWFDTITASAPASAARRASSRRVHALDDDGAAPGLADPAKVRPGDDRLLRAPRRRPRTASAGARAARRWESFIRPPSDRKPASQRGLDQDLRQVGQHRTRAAVDERLRPVADVALAHAGDGGIDGDDQGRVSGCFRARDGGAARRRGRRRDRAGTRRAAASPPSRLRAEQPDSVERTCTPCRRRRRPRRRGTSPAG